MNTHSTTNKDDARNKKNTYRNAAMHPMRELLTILREADENVEDKEAIVQHAQTVSSVCQNGMAAIGLLLAHSSPIIEDGTVGADSVEALGWLITELSDMSTYCLVLAADCRRDPSCAGLSKVA